MVVIVGETRAPRGHCSIVPTPLLGCHGATNRCALVQRCVRQRARTTTTNERRTSGGQHSDFIVSGEHASCNYIKGSCIRLCNNQWSVSQGDKEGIPPWFVAYERDHDSKEIDIISMMRVSRALKGGLGRMQ